jgi:predicted PurR-regulated permease PerM
MPFSFTPEQKQTMLWLTIWLSLALFLVLLGPVLTPFIAAAILAYALNPGVDRISSSQVGRWKIPRSVAVMLMMTLLLAALLAIILIVLPVLQKELPLLQDQFPSLLSKLNATIGPKLQEIGIRVRLDGTGLKKMMSQQFSGSGEEIWSALFSSVKVGGTALVGWMATLFLVPVALFYLLLDWHPLLKNVENSVPRRWVGKSVRLAREVDGLLAQYLRGQLLVMLLLAVYYSAALALAGFDVALPVGIITGLLAFIPYLGYGLGLTLALVTALLQFSELQGLLAVAIIYGAGQVLEGFVLTPRLVGERIGLHPLVVIFALLAFGQMFGFAGVLLALPGSAILSVAFQHMRQHYLESSFYNS